MLSINFLSLLILNFHLKEVFSQCTSLADIITCENTHLPVFPQIASTVETLSFRNVTFGNRGQSFSLNNKTFPQNTPKLSEIFIENSNIENIESTTFDFLKKQLRVLDITTKSVSPRSFSALRLQKLRISGVLPERFSPDAFMDLEQVSTLEIVNSNLKDLKPLEASLIDVFRNVPNPISIDLSRNQLKTLPIALDQIFARLKSLVLAGNPWHCDCDLAWLVRRYNLMSKSERGIEEPVCDYPVSLRGIPFSNLVANISTLSSSQQAYIKSPLYVLCPAVKLESIQLDFQSSKWPQSARLGCNITGGRNLDVRWFGPQSTTDLNATKYRSTQDLVTLYNPSIGRDLIISGYAAVQSHLLINRQNLDDTYVCEGTDLTSSQSTKINIKWPIINPGLDPPISTEKLHNNKNPRIHFEGTHSAFEKQYSLIELLGAIFGTFLITTLIFIIGTRVFISKKGFGTKRKTNETCKNLPKHYLSTTTAMTHSPNDTNSSNTSYGAGLLDQQNAVLSSLLSNANGNFPPSAYYMQQPGTPGLIYQNAHNVPDSLAQRLGSPNLQPGNDNLSSCAYESINLYSENSYDQHKSAGTMLRPIPQIPPPPCGPPPAVPNSNSYLDHPNALFNNPMIAATLNPRGTLMSQQLSAQQQLQYISALAAANLISTNGIAPNVISGGQSNILHNNNSSNNTDDRLRPNIM